MAFFFAWLNNCNLLCLTQLAVTALYQVDNICNILHTIIVFIIITSSKSSYVNIIAFIQLEK